MANVSLQDIVFPGLSNVYKVPAVDNTLAVAGAAADAKKTGDEIGAIKNDLSEKADKTEALSAYIVETETGNIVSFTDGADDVPVKDLQVAIEPVQSGSGDPSPTNIRPISGWTGANVTANGINQFNKNTVVDGFIDESTGALNPLNTYKSTDYIKVIAGASYYVKSEQTGGMWGAWYDKNKTYIRGEAQYANKAITAPNNAEYVRFTVATSQTGNVDTFAVNYPATDTAYHAYNGSSVSVDWTTEAGTVYGGTLDVVSGELVVDRVSVDLGTLNWSRDTNRAGVFYANVATKAEGGTGAYIAMNWLICDTYKYINEAVTTTEDKYVSDYSSYGAKIIFARDTTYTESAEFKTGVSGHYVAYKLATPQTYQLTPQEVATVLGKNNIFADCGNVTVQYRADTKLYIDKVLSA